MGCGLGNTPQQPPVFNAFSMVGHVDELTGLPNYSGFGAGPQARGFSFPNAVCVDPTRHLLFVGDSGGQRVVVYQLNSDNTITTTLPLAVLGQTSFFIQSGDTLTQSTISAALGLACDSAGGRLFVSDTNNSRIMVWNITSITNGQAAINVLGQTLFTTNAGVTSQTGLNGPRGLAFDATNNRLFIADTNNTRVIVQNVASITNGQAAAHVLGQALFTTTNQGTTSTTFKRTGGGIGNIRGPNGVAYDDTDKLLFVADTNNNRVLSFNVDPAVISDGQAALHVLGQINLTSGTGGLSISEMASPEGLGYDSANTRLFVADYENNRILVFGSVGSITDGQNAVGVLGRPDFTSNTVAITQASTPFYIPSGVTNLAYDTTTNNLYVPDHTNRIQVFAAAPGFTNGANAIWNLGHTNAAGTPIYGASYTINWAGPQSAFNTGGIALDTVHHRLFVTDFNDAPDFPLLSGQIAARVLVWDLDSNNNISSLNAAHILGWSGFYNSVVHATTQAIFNIHLAGILYDSADDRLFVTDTINNRVLVFDTATITDGENAVHVLGQTLYTTSTPATTQGGMNAPRGLGYDPATKRLFVADTGNNRVLVHNADPATITNGQNATHVLGQTLFTTAIAATTQSGMSGPQGNIVYDGVNNRVLINDVENNRVLIHNNGSVGSLTNGQNADVVLGQTLFTTSTSNTTRNGLNMDVATSSTTFGDGGGLAYDQTTGRLFVADSSNFRVMLFDAAPGVVSGADAVNMMNQLTYTTVPSLGSFSGISGAGVSLSGAYNPATNTYFDTQWAPDRIMQKPMIHITTASLPGGTSGVAYNQSVAVSQTAGSYRAWAVQSGSLPTGLSLNTASGAITGTPTTPGTYSFTIQVNDYFSTGLFYDRGAYSVTIS